MQAAQGLSLDDQREAIKQCAADRGWVVEEIFVDGGFGEEYRSARVSAHGAGDQKLRRAISAVLVTKLDRLTRSLLRDLCSINEDLLEPHCCNLVAIRDGINTFEPVSKMLLPFLAIIGQIERQNTSERTRQRSATFRNRAVSMEKYRLGSRRLPTEAKAAGSKCPNTHPWLERLVGWYREGVGMSEIARRLNAAGVKTYHGQSREWTKSKIFELLRTMGIQRARRLTRRPPTTSAPRTASPIACAPRSIIERLPTH